MTRSAWIVAGLAACAASLASPAAAQLRAVVVAQGFSSPVAFVPDPTSGSRFFIVEQGGLIRVLDGTDVLPTPLLDLTGQIAHNPNGDERGLLGMAFAPDAAASGRFFVNFTNRDGDTVIARFTRAPATSLTVDPGTRVDLRWPGGSAAIEQPFSNHNGGHLAFGPDGFLYIGLGDGGSGNDPRNNAQTPLSLLGKMLRIDVTVPDTHPTGYRIPPGNPFTAFSPSQVHHEIWSFGLRNPWRYGFDDFGAGATGALLIGDVGQSAREEVSYEPAGAGGRNYGWRIREGSVQNPVIDLSEQPAYLPLTGPLFDYPREVGTTVVGGYVYRGAALPETYRGRYFVADTGESKVASIGLRVNPLTREASVVDAIDHTAELGGQGTVGVPVSFGRDSQGELYLVSLTGRILKIVGDAATLPAPPSDLTASVLGREVMLSWSPPATPGTTGYRLEAGSSSGSSDLVNTSVGQRTNLPVPGVADGTYYVRVRAEGGGALSAPSNEVTVVVAANCTAPPAPTGLQFHVEASRVSLSWTAAPGASGYQVEAGSEAGGADLAVLGVAAPSLVAEAPPGRYFVRVRALNACGTSVPSNEAVVEVR